MGAWSEKKKFLDFDGVTACGVLGTLPLVSLRE